MQIASIGAVLYPLAALACPVGMGAMMWAMMKGHRHAQRDARETSDHTVQLASVELLREEYVRLGEEIERLENRQAVRTSQRP